MRRRIASLLLAGTSTLAIGQQTTPKPAVTTDTVTVTADRGGINDSATSVAVFTQLQLQQTPALALDDRLHSDAGFQLFRRTSSWTANPTSQGLSLRGLGSTAASRTLVVSDQVPLSDPFGGWVHWNEIPALAIDRVELLHGGSADLYGSSAIGGVVDIVPVNSWMTLINGCVDDCPIHSRFYIPFALQADAAGATENSANGDLLLTAAKGCTQALGALSVLSTGGYIATAPTARGAVDVPSNVLAESGRTELRAVLPHHIDSFLLGNVLNEARSNGTPDQTNGTRLWRYVAGADAGLDRTHLLLRGFGSRESYRQSFSSTGVTAATRNTETLTKLQHVPLDEFGAVAQAARPLARNLTAALGLDLRDIRATDDETAVPTSITTSTSARQRETGGYADAIWQPSIHGSQPWSLSGSVRVDNFRTFDAQQVLSNSPKLTPQPTLNELFAGPRLGLVRTLPHGLALTGTAFRAFRGPTMNELYRTGQVGQQTTLANNALLAERATGFEFGGELQRAFGHLRATYFWTEVNRPISAVLLSQTATTQTLQRQNLGQIRSRGLMLEAQTARFHNLDASFGYQLAVATVAAFNSSSPAQANLTGNWIPEVPRESVTGTLHYAAPRLAGLRLIASYQGREFDDAANQYVLHPYARFDLLAERQLPHGLSVFAGAQNLLNRTIDAGLTPVLTLAAPRLVQGGLRYTFAR